MADATQLKRLQDEKNRLDSDVERTKTIMKTSEASKELLDHVVAHQKKDSFATATSDNPYTKKPGSQGGCTIL